MVSQWQLFEQKMLGCTLGLRTQALKILVCGVVPVNANLEIARANNQSGFILRESIILLMLI